MNTDVQPAVAAVVLATTLLSLDLWADVVRRFSAAGEPLPDPESAGLETILALSPQERLTYTVLSYAGIAWLLEMLLGLVLRSASSTRSPQVGAASGPVSSLRLLPAYRGARK